MNVNVFNERKAEEKLLKCPKIVRDYVRLLKKHLNRQQEVTSQIICKIGELTKNLECPKDKCRYWSVNYLCCGVNMIDDMSDNHCSRDSKDLFEPKESEK